MGLSETLTIGLASAGGSAAVVAALGGWIGKSAAERMLEQQRLDNARTLEEFKSSLERARLQHRRNSDALFQLFQLGKLRLIELRSSQHFAELYQSEPEAAIRQQIRQNGESKQDYETCIGELLAAFRAHLELPSNSTCQRPGSAGR